MSEEPRRRVVSRENLVAALAFALTIVAGWLTVHGAYSAFTWGKFRYIDYGRYLNMIWNCGHGRLFTVSVDGTYLATHISPTLALLGPFFRIWDHPFLLSVLQGLSLMGGAAITWRTATTHRLGPDRTAALAFFLVANPFTQAVMLCEFHGVALYFLLMPWLHACLDRRRRHAWLPFLLLMGVREEAGVLAAPMLLYFAARDRWWPGAVMAAVALVYGLFAIHVLFPVLGGVEFVKARASYVFDPNHYAGLLSFRELWTRTAPLAACFLVSAPFLRRRGWLPIAAFPLAAVLVAASAAEPNIFLLRYHYPAAIIVLFTLGILEALIRGAFVSAPRTRLAMGHAIFLIVATLAWHRVAGFLPWGGRSDRIYAVVHPAGEEILRVVKEIPKRGVLLCPSDLAGFCANRADLVTWEWFDERRHRIDLVFLRMKDAGRFRPRYRALLESGEFGVAYVDDRYAILERGRPIERNEEVVRRLSPPP